MSSFEVLRVMFLLVPVLVCLKLFLSLLLEFLTLWDKFTILLMEIILAENICMNGLIVNCLILEYK